MYINSKGEIMLATTTLIALSLLQFNNYEMPKIGESLLPDLNTIAQEVQLKNEYYIPGIELSQELQRHTYLLSKIYNVDYSLIISIMWVESRFDPQALNTANSNGTYDIGLMQINSTNIEWVNELAGRELDLYNPYDNIEAGILIYSTYKNYWKDKVSETELLQRHTLLTYNRGLGGFKKIGFQTHIAYDNKVINYKKEVENL